MRFVSGHASFIVSSKISWLVIDMKIASWTMTRHFSRSYGAKEEDILKNNQCIYFENRRWHFFRQLALGWETTEPLPPHVCAPQSSFRTRRSAWRPGRPPSGWPPAIASPSCPRPAHCWHPNVWDLSQSLSFIPDPPFFKISPMSPPPSFFGSQCPFISSIFSGVGRLQASRWSRLSR